MMEVFNFCVNTEAAQNDGGFHLVRLYLILACATMYDASEREAVSQYMISEKRLWRIGT